MSYIDRRETLLNSIGKSYARQIQNQSTTLMSSVIQQLIVQCGSGDYCKKCIDKFPNIKIDKIRETSCAGLCLCDIENINMKTTIVWKPSQEINTSDLTSSINKIVEEVKKEMSDKYGETDISNEYNQTITDIITKVNINSKQIINQMMNSSQSIQLTGAGITLSIINIDVTINSIMEAIAGVCQNNELCGINNIIQQDMSIVQKKVQKDVETSFSFIWKKIKIYAISALIFFGVILLTIIFLLIFKAVKK
jgi:hypothetical protein